MTGLSFAILCPTCGCQTEDGQCRCVAPERWNREPELESDHETEREYEALNAEYERMTRGGRR